MKFGKYFVGLVLLFAVLSCKKQEPGFEMLYQKRFDLPIGLSPSSSHNFKFNDIASDTATFFNLHSATASQVTRIIPQSMSLRALIPSGESSRYNFIARVEVWISDPRRPNLGEQIAFFRNDVPLDTGTQLDLIPNDIDVRPFLLNGSRYSIRINVELRDFSQKTIETEWNASFFAKI